MEMFKKYGKFFLRPNIQTITKQTAQDIYKLLSSKDIPTVIDMEGVENCSNEFLFMFKKLNNLSLLNVESRLLSVLYLTGFDKYVKIFGETVSLFDDEHELINRRFSIV